MDFTKTVPMGNAICNLNNAVYCLTVDAFIHLLKKTSKPMSFSFISFLNSQWEHFAPN